MKSKLYLIICLLCCCVVVGYLCFFTKDRFLSKSQFSIIVDSKTGVDSSASLMSLLGGGQGTVSHDTQTTIGFIHSADLLLKLEKEFNLVEHYQSPKSDIVYKLEEDASLEDRLSFYRKSILPQYNNTTGLIDLSVESYSPELSLKLSKKILGDTEEFINSLNHKVANERLKFVKAEVDRAQENVELYEKKLIEFQNKHKIIQPEAIIAARLEAIQGLRLEKINKEVKLSTIRAASNNSPLIPELITSIKKLEEEISVQEEKLSGDNQQKLNNILADFKTLQTKLAFALKLREGAEILMEQTRAESITKSRFFSVIQNPYLAEEYTNPRRVYLSLTYCICIILIFYVVRAFWLSIFDRV